MLAEKYQSLIDMAGQLNVSGLDVQEENGVLKINGSVGSAATKQQLWDEYARLDPDYRSGDLVLDISSPEAASSTYTVQSGDTLSKIGSNHGVTWQSIFEANRDKLDDPDKIQPGQQLNIPQ